MHFAAVVFGRGLSRQVGASARCFIALSEVCLVDASDEVTSRFRILKRYWSSTPIEIVLLKDITNPVLG